MTRWERWQVGAVAVAVTGGLLGLLTAGGCSPTPPGPPGLAGGIHVLLLLLSVAAGIAAFLRMREVETARWQAAQDPYATKGEREYAHREAESQRRMASTAFLLAPIGIAFWLAYVFESQGRFTPSDLFLITPVLGFLLTLMIAPRFLPPPPKPDSD